METRRIVLGAQRIPGRIQRQRVLIREVRTPSLAVNQLGGDIALAVYLANLNRRSGRARQAWIEENNTRRGKLRKMNSHRQVDYLRENRRGKFSNSRLTAIPRHSSSQALRSKLGQV